MQNQSFFRLIFASSAQLEVLDTEQLFTYLLTCVETNITYYFAIFLDKIHKLLKSQKKVLITRSLCLLLTWECQPRSDNL